MQISWLSLSALIGFTFATVAWTQTPIPKAAPPSDAVKQTARANNDFTCDMMRELAKEEGKNTFFSPWSISSALAMTLEGARNDTAEEMGKTLRLPPGLHQGGEQPWRLEPYHLGFAEMQRRCTPPRDLVKDAATRDKVVAMRKELATVNQQLNKRYTPEMEKKALQLASNINHLEAQIDLFELNVANAVWGEKTYPFDAGYIDSVTRHYGKGLVREADFINQFPAERAKINRWVEEQTKNKIKDLIPELRPEEARLLRMVLVNAIYFKGQWSEPFKKESTRSEPFFLGSGATIKAPLMNSTLSGRYAAFNEDGSYFETPQFVRVDEKAKTYPGDGGFVIAEIPYKGNKLAMTVIVPRKANGLPAIEKKLTGESLTHWLGRLQARSVQVKLPKFKLDTHYELGKSLSDLGMKKAFEEKNADFTGMSKSGEKLYISRVIHKAFVDVNEEGTEAAAATAVMMATPSSMPLAFPFTPIFNADRPFLCLIREVETGAVLFMGRITNPNS
jgi:serpin B